MNRRHFITTTAASLAVSARSADASSKLRVGLIGHTGRGNYGHGIDSMWGFLPETEIVGVADADATGLAAELKKLKFDKGFADYKAMLAATKPDIVAVGPRQIDQHRDMCMAAIAAGARGIYIEKPFCRSLAEADEIIAAAEKTGTKIAIAHRNRYQLVLPVIARLIKEDALGKVLEVRARGKEDKRGGSLDLWVLGGHVLNVATFFAGQPKACSAVVLQDGRPVTKEDVKDGDEGIGPLAGNEVHARFETGGVPIFFDSVHDAGVKTAGFGVQIIGTKGIIDMRMDEDPFAQFLAGNPFDPVKEPHAWQPISTAGIGEPEPIADAGKQVMNHSVGGRDLIAAMNDAKRQPLCSAYDARTAIEMISAVFESHRLEGKRVTLPLSTRVNPLTLL